MRSVREKKKQIEEKKFSKKNFLLYKHDLNKAVSKISRIHIIEKDISKKFKRFWISNIYLINLLIKIYSIIKVKSYF